MADDDTLPADAPDPETIAEAEELNEPARHRGPRTTNASDPTDPIGHREDATHRD